MYQHRVSAYRVVSDYIRTWAFERLVAWGKSDRRELGRDARIFVLPDDHIGSRIATRGHYDRYRLEAIQKLILNRRSKLGIGQEGVALDIGTNVGNHAIFFGSFFDRVYGFEPIPALVHACNASILMSGAENVSVFMFGLSNSDNELFIEPVSNNAGASSIVDTVTSTSLKIKVRHGDPFLTSMLSPDEVIEFVKVDVEGHEPLVFSGIRETLTKHKPLVWFEANDQLAAIDSMGLLREMGYKHFSILGDPKESLGEGLRGWIARMGGLTMSLNHILDKPPAQNYMNILASFEPI